MDLKTVRALLVSERGRLKLTQQQVAERAGVNQSNLSKIEDLSRSITELRARILFNVIEKGLCLSLSSFFAQIENLQSGKQPVQDRIPQEIIGVEEARASSEVLSGGGGISDLEAFQRVFGRAINELCREQVLRNSPTPRAGRAGRRTQKKDKRAGVDLGGARARPSKRGGAPGKEKAS